MKQTIYLIMTALLLTLASCEKTIEFKQKQTDPLMVLNCVAEADSQLCVTLSRSRFFLDSDETVHYLTGAEVELYVDGDFKETLQESQVKPYEWSTELRPVYESSYRPAVGDRLQLKVASFGDLPGVNAETVIPAPAGDFHLADSSFRMSSWREEWQYSDQYINLQTDTGCVRVYCNTLTSSRDLTWQLDYTFTDPAGRGDSYVLSFNYLGENDSYGYFYLSDVTMRSDFAFETLSSSQEAFYYDDLTVMFSDEFCDGSLTHLTFSITYQEYVTDFYLIDPPLNYEDTLHNGQGADGVFTIDLKSLSESGYLFLKTTQAYEDDWMQGIFTEPIQIHSNVDGGIGIFSGQSRKTDSLHVTTPMYGFRTFDWERLYY